jgi:glucose-6-phosphate isomerase
MKASDMTAMLRLTARQSWKALQVHRNDIGERHLRALFAADATRGERLTAEAVGIDLDYSKNRITDETGNEVLNTSIQSIFEASNT